MGRILSGIQPTGNLHLGNYLGAIRNWVNLQKEGARECLYCVVDLHAITVPQNPQDLKHQIREATAVYLAAGIDPAKSVIFQQSRVPAHSELAWLFNTLTPLGWLNRMTQFKDKVGKNRDKASLGLYAYPVLMAADILIYKATHVPVGDDQKQHVELCRDIAGAFNRHVGEEFLPLPEPLILGGATRVMSLRDGTKKMGKSDASDMSRIHLTDSADTIAQKIKKAKTDPHPLPATREELKDRPEALNLLTIYAALAEISLEEALKEFAGKQFSAFKSDLADLTVTKITPMGKEIARLMADPPAIDKILAEGAPKAQKIAGENLARIHTLMGF